MGFRVKVRGTDRVRIDADAGNRKRVTASGASAYYGSSSVSATSNDGTIASGQTINLTQTRFFLTAGGHTSLSVADVTEKTLDVTVVDPRDYGAVVDGVADDAPAYVAAIAACPTGGTVLVPHGKSKWSTAVPAVTKAIRLEGVGVGSEIRLAYNSTTDGLTIGSAGTALNGFQAANFSITGGTTGGAAVCRHALVLLNVHRSSFRDVYVCAGTDAAGWGVSIEGALLNVYDMTVVGGNMTFPGGDTGRCVNGVRAISSAIYPANANKFDLRIEALAGDGFLVDGTGAYPSSYNNWISGTFEGIVGKGIWLNTSTNWVVHGAHVEALEANVLTDNKVVLTNCGRGIFSGGFECAAMVEVTGCTGVEFGPSYVHGLTIDSASNYTKVGNLGYSSGGFTDASTTTFGDGRLFSIVQTNTSAAPPPAIGVQNLIPGGELQYWAADLPLGGPTGKVNSGTLTRSGTAAADTRKLFGTSAAKMVATGADFAIRGHVPDLEVVKGRWVTCYAWTYIAASQSPDPAPRLRCAIVDGATTTYERAASTLRDGWQLQAVTSLIPTTATSVYVESSTAQTSGTWYVGRIGVVLGRAAPQVSAPVVPRRSVGTATWDPGSVADGAMASTTVTALGATVGDVCAVGFSQAVTAGAILSGAVTAADTVTVTLFNKTGGALDLASGTLRAESWAI